MSVFFTADMHFGHANIIKYCHRPYLSAGEMDEALIKNWNSVVKPMDKVYHIGDFAFSRDAFANNENSIIHRLNGVIFFVKGNHDRFTAPDIQEITVGGIDIVLCHYAMRVWNKSHKGAWHLYGHTHGNLPDDLETLSTDVGTDRWNYTPVSFDTLIELFAQRKNKLLL